MKQLTLGLIFAFITSTSTSATAGFFDNFKEQLDETLTEAKGKLSETVTESKDRLNEKVTKTTEQLENKVNETTGEIAEPIPEVPSISGSESQPITTRRSERTSPKNSNIDIIGLRLGMPVQESKITLQRYDTTLQLNEITGHLPKLTNVPYPQQITATSRTGERINVILTSPPLASTVAQITRIKKYNQGSQPTINNTLRALKNKYGEPSIEKNTNPTIYQLTWLHDQHGNKHTASSPELEQNCTKAVPAEILINLQHQKRFNPAECGVALTVLVATGSKMDLESSRIISDGLVSELAASMTNVSELLRNAHETQNHIDRTLNTQAESQGDPRL